MNVVPNHFSYWMYDAQAVTNNPLSRLQDSVRGHVLPPRGLLPQRPGNHQELSRQFNPHLGLDSFLPLPARELTFEIHDNVWVSRGCNKGCLIQRVSEFSLVLFGSDRAYYFRVLCVALSTKTLPGQFENLVRIIKRKWIANSTKNLG